MATLMQDKPANDGTRLGEYAATQPLSGVRMVGETFSVKGLGRGGYVRKDECSEAKKPS